MKRELYTLTAVMIDSVFQHALKAKDEGKYPPYGLIGFDHHALDIQETPRVINSIAILQQKGI